MYLIWGLLQPNHIYWRSLFISSLFQIFSKFS
nr:MAG TPA: hypothetical protein [Crassvirales sp.]